MKSMKALIRSLTEMTIPDEIVKMRMPIPKLDAVSKAANELLKAVKALEAKRKEMAGVRPLMHYEVDVPRKDYEATDMAKGAREIFEARKAVYEAQQKFVEAWDAWKMW